MIADIVKERRTAKGYTQKELADISNISIRSIQRIENGEVVPRMYTLKTLAECLDFSLDLLNKEEKDDMQISAGNRSRKVILSAGSGFLLFFLALAFLAQSANFPETGFEFLLYCAFIVFLYTIILLVIWTTKSKK